MKLYDVPRNTKVRVLGGASGPPGEPYVKQNNVLFFRCIDGIYSVCTLDDKNPIDYDKVIHLSAFTEVEIL